MAFILGWGEATSGSKLNIELEAIGLEPGSLAVSPYITTLLDDLGESEARDTLGVAIGSDVQAYNANLAWLATNLTPFAMTLLDDDDLSEALTTLSIGASREIIQPTTDWVVPDDLIDTITNNYGQAAVDIQYWLPEASAGMQMKVVIGTTQAGNKLYIVPKSPDIIYLDGSAGSVGQVIETAPTKGTSLSIVSFKTGVASWSWLCITDVGTWAIANIAFNRITSTGDRRVTSTGDVRVIAY
jgi:hypothetical protein